MLSVALQSDQTKVLAQSLVKYTGQLRADVLDKQNAHAAKFHTSRKSRKEKSFKSLQKQTANTAIIPSNIKHALITNFPT